MQFLPVFVALEKGFYKRNGLDAELIELRFVNEVVTELGQKEGGTLKEIILVTTLFAALLRFMRP
jgi:NMT1/THI5 like